MSFRGAKPEHEAVYQDLCQLLLKHAGHLDGYEMLAVAANLVGKLVAMQDQRKVTAAMAMEVVAKNIEYGNQQTLKEVGKSKGSA